MKLVPYSEYKDSDVPWLGRIPVHWEMRRLKHLFSERLQKGYPNETLLAATQTRGIISKSMYETRTVTAQKDLHLLKLVEIGDFVISLRSFQGGIEQAYFRGIISPAYTVMIPCPSIERNYFKHLAKSKTFLSLLKICVTGIREGQNIDYERLRRYFLPLPSITEQTQIARFLDSKTAQIDKFTRNKQRLIELLKEQKQNVINQAVTRGLDPNVKLKPSGVEWLGDIPEHWEVTKLKRVVNSNPSKSEARASLNHEEKVVFLPMENISANGDIDCSEKRPLSEVWNGFTYFQRGDVVIAKITPCFENGKGAYLKGLESDFGFGTTELIVLRPSKAIDGAFLRFLTSTRQFLLLGARHMTGAAGQQRIPSDFVKNYPIGLPPISEQLEILEHIQKKLAEIDQAITRAQREIDLMHEYRARLISDVVTGQVDVRGVEAPELAEEALPLLDKDAGSVWL